MLDPSGNELARGSDAVAEFYRRTVILYDGSPQTEHTTSDVEIDVDESLGTARSKYVVHQMGVRVAAGRYADDFRRIDGVWRFASRQFFLDESREIGKHITIETT